MVITFIVIAFIILLHRPLYQAHHTNLHQQYHRYTNCKSGFSGFVVKKSHAKDRPDAATKGVNVKYQNSPESAIYYDVLSACQLQKAQRPGY